MGNDTFCVWVKDRPAPPSDLFISSKRYELSVYPFVTLDFFCLIHFSQIPNILAPVKHKLYSFLEHINNLWVSNSVICSLITVFVLAHQLAMFYHKFISLSVFKDYSVTQHYLVSKDIDDVSKKYMTYNVTYRYITFYKVLWQFNNPSRILQKIF